MNEKENLKQGELKKVSGGGIHDKTSTTELGPNGPISPSPSQPVKPGSITEIVCPQCGKGNHLEIISLSQERKRFRCKDCGIEFTL